MGLTSDAYQRMLTALLPPGRLWRLNAGGLSSGGSLLSALLLGCSDELARLDGRVNDLLNEADPSTAVELLPDYETELALVAASTTAERQANIVARLVAQQGFRPADFQTALAALLAQVAANIVVLERTHAFASSVGDDREIYRFFIYRNPTLPGTYFLASAQALVDAIRPSHTIGQVIESINADCDDAHSLCDRDIIGATPVLAASIISISPAGSANTNTTLTWSAQIDVGNVAQSNLSGRLTVTYPAGGRPSSPPTIVTTPAGWTAGAWSTSGANAWVCTVTAASSAVGDSAFALSASTGTIAGTLVLGVDTLLSTEMTTAGLIAAAVNSSVTVTSAATWTVDATSNKGVPATAAEWTAALSAAGITSGGPSFIWLMQDTASPASEALGTGVTLATSGTAGTFSAAVAGWSRKGWQSPGDGVAGRLLSQSASLPDPTTTSALIIMYAAVLAAPAAERQLASCIGNGTAVYASVTATPTAKVYDGPNSASGASNIGTAVRLWIMKYDHTHSTVTLYTDQEKLSPTFAAAAGKALVIGQVNTSPPSMWCGYAAMFTGAAAELTDAQVKALLQQLGWTIPWT